MITSNHLKNLSEDQKLSKLCSEAGLRSAEIGQFFYALPSPREEGNQSLCREYTMHRDQEGTRLKGWIQSNVRFGPVSDIKVCNHNGRYSIEVQVQSLFQDRTVSWIRIVNGIDKFVREAMPIQEEEKASEKPAAKARPILKPSSISDVNFIPIGQRNGLTFTETQESNNSYCFQVSKFITRLLRHSQKVHIEKMMEQSIMTKLLMNARKSNSTILNIGQLRDEEGIRQCVRIGRLKNGYQFWQKVEDKRKVLSILLGSELSSSIPVPSSNSRTFRSFLLEVPFFSVTINPALQDNVLLPEGCYRVYLSRRKRKRIEVNSEPWFDSRRVSLRTGRQAVFFTIVNPMDNQDGLGETLCDLSQARIAPYKNTWKRFQNTVCWCNLKLAQQRGLQFYQTRSNAVILYDTLLAEFIEKAICMKTKDQLYQRESVILRPRVVLKANSQCGSQDLCVQEARSS